MFQVFSSDLWSGVKINWGRGNVLNIKRENERTSLFWWRLEVWKLEECRTGDRNDNCPSAKS
jgi:hypothetical protein